MGYKEMSDEESEMTLNLISTIADAMGLGNFFTDVSSSRPKMGDFERVTNFNPEMLSVYEDSIKKYNKISSDPRFLKVGPACKSYPDGMGLWINSKDGRKDLSVFWRVFDEIKAKRNK